MSAPVVRPAARVVVLDEQGCVLLQRFRRDDGMDIWITPGGAIEEGETALDAARRELIEETGVKTELLGPVWTRRHIFEWNGKHLDQRETFFVARLDARVEAAPTLAAEAIVAEGIHEHRWWGLDELEGASILVAPRRLARLLRDLEASGIPSEPFDVGV